MTAGPGGVQGADAPAGGHDSAAPAVGDPQAGGSTPVPGIGERATVGVFWSAAQTWLVRLSTLLAFVLLGRLLTPQEFGVVALAMSVITVLGVVSDAGLGLWVVQKRGLTPAAISTAFWISLVLGVVLAGLLAATAVPVAALLDSPDLRLILPVLASTLVVTGLSAVPAALLRRELRFKELAVRQVVATGLSVVVAVVLALAGAGVWALVAQTLVRVVVAAVVLLWTSGFRPSFRLSREDAWDMTRYGTRSLGVTLGGAVRGQGEPFIIGVALGTVALGYWSIAARLVHVVVELCSAAIGAVAGPVFSELQDEPERLRRAFSRVLAAGGLLLVPLMTALSLASGELVPLVFGDQWVVAAGVASILAAAFLVTGLDDLQRNLLLGTGRAGPELRLTVLSLVGQLGLILAVSGRGLRAVAVAVAVWAVVVFVARAVVIRRQLGTRFHDYAQLLAVLLSGGVAAAAVLAVVVLADVPGLAGMAVVALVGGPVFLCSAWLLARPTVQDAVAAVTLLRRRRSRRGAAEPSGDEAPGGVR